MTSEASASASGSIPDDLLSAAISAARSARDKLGQVANELQQLDSRPAEVDPLAKEVSEAVGALYAVEAGDPSAVRDGLQQAMQRLRTVLAGLQDIPEAPAPIEQAMPLVAQTLATLHPTYSEIERRLPSSEPEQGRSEEEAFPLQQTHGRREHKQPLEVVPDADEEPSREPERRASPRVEMDVGVGFQSESNFFTGFTGDISEGGLFIATYEVLPIGTEMEISVWIPDGRQVTAKGRVQWVREPMDFSSEMHPGMGVKFEQLSEEAREAIHRFIRKREPLFHED